MSWRQTIELGLKRRGLTSTRKVEALGEGGTGGSWTIVLVDPFTFQETNIGFLDMIGI